MNDYAERQNPEQGWPRRDATLSYKPYKAVRNAEGHWIVSGPGLLPRTFKEPLACEKAAQFQKDMTAAYVAGVNYAVGLPPAKAAQVEV